MRREYFKGFYGHFMSISSSPLNGSLIVPEVSQEDEGTYRLQTVMIHVPGTVHTLSRCLASSPLGPPLSSLASLDIQMAPHFPKLGEEVVPVSRTGWG